MMFNTSSKTSKVDQWLAKKSTGTIDRDEDGIPLMTPGTLKCCAVQNDGFETPECNDKLYLHFQGFKCIENLEPYTNLKCVWLESNGLTCIEGLETCVELRSLYLQQNLIKTISGLSTLVNLVTLDLSQNIIERVAGLSSLPKLSTLNLSSNALSTIDSVSHLAQCVSLTNIDLQGNQLKDPEVIEQVLAHIPRLTALYLKGNPLVTKTKHFRRHVLSTIAKLMHLDDMPVFEKERICVEAWKVGGKEAEKAAREALIEKDRQEDHEYVENFRKWKQEKVEARKAQMEEEKRLGIESTVSTSYVAYNKVDDQEANEREDKRKAIGKAEADAVRHSKVVGEGVCMMDMADYAPRRTAPPLEEDLLEETQVDELDEDDEDVEEEAGGDLDNIEVVPAMLAATPPCAPLQTQPNLPNHTVENVDGLDTWEQTSEVGDKIYVNAPTKNEVLDEKTIDVDLLSEPNNKINVDTTTKAESNQTKEEDVEQTNHNTADVDSATNSEACDSIQIKKEQQETEKESDGGNCEDKEAKAFAEERKWRVAESLRIYKERRAAAEKLAQQEAEEAAAEAQAKALEGETEEEIESNSIKSEMEKVIESEVLQAQTIAKEAKRAVDEARAQAEIAKLDSQTAVNEKQSMWDKVDVLLTVAQDEAIKVYPNLALERSSNVASERCSSLREQVVVVEEEQQQHETPGKASVSSSKLQEQQKQQQEASKNVSVSSSTRQKQEQQATRIESNVVDARRYVRDSRGRGSRFSKNEPNDLKEEEEEEEEREESEEEDEVLEWSMPLDGQLRNLVFAHVYNFDVVAKDMSKVYLRMNPMFDRRTRSTELSTFFSSTACQARFVALNGINNTTAIVSSPTSRTQVTETPTTRSQIDAPTNLSTVQDLVDVGVHNIKADTETAVEPKRSDTLVFDEQEVDEPTDTNLQKFPENGGEEDENSEINEDIGGPAPCGVPMPSVKLEIPALPSMLTLDDDEEEERESYETGQGEGEQWDGVERTSARPLHRVELLRKMNKGLEGHPLERELAEQFVNQHGGNKGVEDVKGERGEFKWD